VLHQENYDLRSCFQGYTAIVGRRFAQAFQAYRPNLVVSVHPLMQHVPVGVNKHNIKFPIQIQLSGLKQPSNPDNACQLDADSS